MLDPVGIFKWIQSYTVLLFLTQIVLCYVFVVSGLIVCFLMLVACITIWPWNKSLYRRIVVNLAYAHWCQLTFATQWWSDSDCTVYLEDPGIEKYVGKEHTLVLMNHKYDIEWLMAWILAERRSMLGGTKLYAKSVIKWLPLIGWEWFFTETIFIKRQWEKDRQIISRDLEYIAEYPDNYPCNLLLFCEGTRFTEAKHKASMEVAKKKGLPLLKHHLLPRTKGFVLSVNGIKGVVPSILDLTIVFRGDATKTPTFMNILNGDRCHSEIFIRRFPLEDVPTETDEECAMWLHKLFQRKDEIYEHFVENGCFKIGQKYDVPRRPNDLYTSLAWIVLLSIPLVYAIVSLITSGSIALLLATALLIFIGYKGLSMMMTMSEVKQSTSSYGLDKVE